MGFRRGLPARSGVSGRLAQPSNRDEKSRSARDLIASGRLTQLQLGASLDLDPTRRHTALQSFTVKFQCVVAIGMQPVGFKEKLHTSATDIGLPIQAHASPCGEPAGALAIDHRTVALGNPVAVVAGVVHLGLRLQVQR